MYQHQDYQPNSVAAGPSLKSVIPNTPPPRSALFGQGMLPCSLDPFFHYPVPLPRISVQFLSSTLYLLLQLSCMCMQVQLCNPILPPTHHVPWDDAISPVCDLCDAQDDVQAEQHILFKCTHPHVCSLRIKHASLFSGPLLSLSHSANGVAPYVPGIHHVQSYHISDVR
eukprot:1139162-Pelagomonas_calceolata.AAC.1